MAKAKKSQAKKSQPKKSKSAKKTKKSVKRASASAARGTAKPGKVKPGKVKKTKTKTKVRKTAKASRSATAKLPAKKAAPAQKKQVMGEGDYQASRRFLKDQGDFVKRHSAEIPKMGKEAEQALDGPEGDTLRQAEDEARGHAHE